MALYGKDDVPSNLEIISLVLLGSFLTVSLFLAASTLYYRRKVRAYTIEEGRAASKSLLKKFGYFLLCPSKQSLPISFQIKLMEYFPKKQKEQRHKQLWYNDKMVVTEN